MRAAERSAYIYGGTVWATAWLQEWTWCLAYLVFGIIWFLVYWMVDAR